MKARLLAPVQTARTPIAADRLIRNAKPHAKAYEIALGIGGLSATIAADGVAKTLYWRGKLGKRVIRVRLGNYPDKTIAEALNDAREAQSAARNGKDPNLAKRLKKDKADAPATIREAAERFKTEHLDANRGDRWRAEAWRILDVDALPEIGKYRLADVKRAQLTALVARKAASLRSRGLTGVAANRLVAVLGRFFRFCADKGWVEANPAVRLPKPVEKEPERDRVLSEGELGAVWNALANGEAGPVYSQILALLALTGCRVSEIAGLRRADVDLDGGTIRIVKGKTKESARMLPVGPTARAMLVEIVESADTTGRLFSAPEGGSVEPQAISKAVRALRARLGQERWTPHDLRRTLISALHEAGFGEGVIRRIAGHTATDVHGAVYDRSKRLESVGKALAHYESHVLSCAAAVGAARESNVVALRAS